MKCWMLSIHVEFWLSRVLFESANSINWVLNDWLVENLIDFWRDSMISGSNSRAKSSFVNWFHLSHSLTCSSAKRSSRVEFDLSMGHPSYLIGASEQPSHVEPYSLLWLIWPIWLNQCWTVISCRCGIWSIDFMCCIRFPQATPARSNYTN